MREKLFLDEDLEFEKISMSYKLSSDPQSWPQEISSELYRQHPFLSDYDVRVDLSRMDPERGYAFGAADVGPQTEGVFNAKARIPLIVKEGQLQPVDVFFKDSEAYPLTEERFRDALFRSSPVEPSNIRPRDAGLVDQLYPPLRTNYGYGSSGASGIGSASSFGIGKMASDRSIIAEIAHTIPAKKMEEFINRVDSDVQLKTAALKNDAFLEAAYTLAQGVQNENSTEILKEKIAASIVPTVVMLTKTASGKYVARWSNPDAFLPQEEELSALEAKASFGPEVLDIAPNSYVVATTEPVANGVALTTNNIGPITKEGQYRCASMSDSSLIEGTVLPIRSFDGHDTGSLLFLSEEGYAVQDRMAGEKIASANISLLEHHPKGFGVFCSPTYSLPPIHINGVVKEAEDVEKYYGTDGLGNPLELIPTLGLLNITKVAEHTYAIPAGMRFYRLGNKLDISDEADSIVKVAEYKNISRTLDLKYAQDGFYHLEGVQVEKLAEEDRTFLNEKDAVFLLANLGMAVDNAKEKLAEARKFSKVTVVVPRGITTFDELMEEEREKIASLREFVIPSVDLVKEAASLEDAQTVDKILSLNFINPDNLHTFLSYLPELESTMSKVAEMLVASRLGLNQVPETALERSLKGLDAVVYGLKSVNQKLESASQY